MKRLNRNEVLQYFIDTYFHGDVSKAAEETGYSRPQVEAWLDGSVTPMRQTVEYLVHTIFTPEFKVIVEFAEFDANEQVKPQLRDMLGNHGANPGIYAFYDSTGDLLYVGKATTLLDESYSSILREVTLNFPSQVRNAPSQRYEIVRYVSAYDVGTSEFVDYPKHVESLILRISKPPLNRITGGLEPAYSREDDS